MQSVHALGPTSQLAKTGLGLLAAGYFESSKNDIWGLGGGRNCSREALLFNYFFLKCKQLNLEKQNRF